MSFGPILRLAGIAALTLGLAGCIDTSIDIEVLSQTTARATTTQTINAEFYPMIQASAVEGEEGFCDNGALTEHPDGSATCLEIEEGPFESLMLGAEDGDSGITFSAAGPGLVRVAFDTAGLGSEVGVEDELDSDTIESMRPFFSGHAITIRIRGADLIETNMERVGNAAETVVPLMDLIENKVDLPDELYAIVRVP